MKKNRHSLVRRLGAGILTALMLLSSTAFAETATETISTTKNIQRDGSYEVVIVGAGGAGLGAACTAGEAGVKTLVIEQEVSETHSNTAYSGGTFMAAETSLEKEKGIVDSKEGWRKFIDCMTLRKPYDDITSGSRMPMSFLTGCIRMSALPLIMSGLMTRANSMRMSRPAFPVVILPIRTAAFPSFAACTIMQPNAVWSSSSLPVQNA